MEKEIQLLCNMNMNFHKLKLKLTQIIQINFIKNSILILFKIQNLDIKFQKYNLDIILIEYYATFL